MNFQTKPSFYQPIGIEVLCERESPMCFQTKPLFSSQWESQLYLIRFGNTLNCPSHKTLIHSPFSNMSNIEGNWTITLNFMLI